jgi:uncharacterized membrane protein YjgN (DUF898 family)
MQYGFAQPGPAAQPQPQRRDFSFTGSGSEYFRIWIVNLLLTILTLGIYSAWAKVRRTQYFYQNTVVDGSSFEYHGKPWAILKGRLIALGLFLVYNVMLQSGSGWLALAALIGLAAVMPWLLWKSLQFRARNSSWRGVHLGFGGSLGQAYVTFLVWPLLAGLSLYTLLPLTHHQIKAWQHSRARFGQTSFSMKSCIGAFYMAYLMIVGVLILGLVAMGVFGVFAAFGGSPEAKAGAGVGFVFAILGLYFVLLALGPIFAAKIFNAVWSHTELGPHRFESRIPLGRAAFVGVTNILGIAFTLGLFIPWAAVRWAKLRAEHLTLWAATPLDEFVAQAQEKAGTLGDAAADLGDFDLGL